ncbi:MAG: hypothetical protein K6C36_08210 [Clostridia bacterium]|nr:hypothetical protein [Clostridia bacterium]
MLESYDKRLALCNIFWFVSGLWQIFSVLLDLSATSESSLALSVFAVFRVVFLLLGLSTYVLCFLSFKEASKDVETHGDDPVFRRGCRVLTVLVPVSAVIGLGLNLFVALKDRLTAFLATNTDPARAAAAKVVITSLTNYGNMFANLAALVNLTAVFLLLAALRQKGRPAVVQAEWLSLVCWVLSLIVMLICYLRGIITHTPAESSVFLIIFSKLLMTGTYVMQFAAFYVRDKDVRSRITSA